jgi:glutaredoxin 2
MSLTLYHYVHCPFCIRVRMALGYLNLPYKSVVLPYDDETTPLKLTGKKMLPIIEKNGKAINESLDIIALIDEKNLLNGSEVQTQSEFSQFSELLNKLGSNVHSLAMPYWIYTPEFNESSRAYFQKKKEEKRGPFNKLVQRSEEFISPLLNDLKEVEKNLYPFYKSEHFSLYDILLASHIWGLYVVPEFQFPEKVHHYLQEVKKVTKFNYHKDFWEV